LADIKLSVIIPVYNVELYLRQCLDSVFSQNVKDLEVICVNDGSTDGSGSILQEFKVLYSEIIIINKQNAGLPAARNSGFDVAKGEYIYYLDSDDYLLPGVLQKMLDFVVSKKLDLAFFNVLKEGVEPYFKISREITEVLTGIELYTANYRINAFFPPSAVWMYLFKKAFLDKFNIRFKEGIEHEDEEYTPRAYFFAERVSYLNIPIQFHRVMREGSVTAATNLFFKESNLRDLVETAADLYVYLNRNLCTEKYFYLKVFEIYFTVAQLVVKQNPKRKNYLFHPEDYQIMKTCSISWEWYVYYWLFRYNTSLFAWYVSDSTPPMQKKMVNKLFKLFYR